MKKVKKNQLKIVIFTAVKNRCIIAWACFRYDNLDPQFYIVKLGYKGFMNHFFIFDFTHRLWV